MWQNATRRRERMKIQFEEGQMLSKALAYDLWLEHREMLFVHYREGDDPCFSLRRLARVTTVGDCELAVSGQSLISVYTTLSDRRILRCIVHADQFLVDDVQRIIMHSLTTMNLDLGVVVALS
jgi:hypothetical protein